MELLAKISRKRYFEKKSQNVLQDSFTGFILTEEN